MNIKYCSPSYHRATGVTILDYLPQKVMLYVSPEDYPQYVKAIGSDKNIVVVPEGVQGKGKAHVMNWILDNEWEESTDALIILDDDIECVCAHTRPGQKLVDYPKTEEEFYELCENYALLCKEWGFGMFGYNYTSDPLVYREFSPFRTLSYIDGGCQGFVKNKLRYDERLTVKEDVDMFLQNVKEYRGALRIDRYYLKKKSFEGEGGSNEFRKDGVEKEQFQMMQRKWGADIVRPNRPKGIKADGIRAKGGAIKINLPIGGI